MERTDLDILAEEVLSQLEIQETGLLSWGFLGGKFAVGPYIRRILENPATQLLEELWEQRCQSEGEEQGVQSIANNLRDRKLLFIDKEGMGRTRFAETIRLIYLLKQRFNLNDWQTAPDLVSNMKIQLNYRRYPTRDIDIAQVNNTLKEAHVRNPIYYEVIETLLGGGSLRLSSFQVKSLSHLLGTLRSQDAAIIIGAGTGSGKTKAFYLPVFARISQTIASDPSHWARVLAIYPRVELLKDQLKESLRESLKLNYLLGAKGLRPITVGTYFGGTPKVAKDIAESKFNQWGQGEEGFICPYLSCPHCDGQLVWRYDDYQAEVRNNSRGSLGKYEILHCQECGQILGHKNIVLTRKRMELTPPDILFTTTEMLNRKLSSIHDQHIFGIQSPRPPQFVLLDEVHIYSGITGSHVAYLLRRWRNLVRRHSQGPVHYVGLSATLTNPKFYFSNLVGAPEYRTTYISPAEDDLVAEGMEYNLVVRGDPISATTLLSRSVQSATVLGRMLDPLGKSVSTGAWGAKIFGFTDKLDVINRWYHIELDAERNKILSKYRDINEIDRATERRQIQSGQVWHLAEKIDKRSLKKPLGLGITSSQTRGVDPDAKMVIATSTLEVGYNDPEVGGIIQHKAPRDMASFLQRKGRAGRTRGMRPWTVVVTSAYGRDMWAYENPEQIFSPVLPELNLPMRNSYSQHIQAAFAVMDWIGLNLCRRGFRHSNAWQILSPRYQGRFKEEKRVIAEMLEQVISGNYTDLSMFIEESLKLDQASLYRVLWHPPRSILLDLIPSLLGRLSTDWGQFVYNNRVLSKPESLGNAPLAGYVPVNLFSSLQVSDLIISLPGKEEKESLPLRQGMFEFAPGNVSKRFANVNRIREAHWLPIPIDEGIFDIDSQNITARPIDETILNNERIHVYQPQEYCLEVVPREITDRTTGFLRWKVEIEPNGGDVADSSGGRLLTFKDSELSKIIDGVHVFCNEDNKWVKFIRYAQEMEVEVKFPGGRSNRKQMKIFHGEKPAALGFQVYVDAVAIKCVIPDLRQLPDSSGWNNLLSNLRPEYYLYLLRENDNLTGCLSVFEIEWLWQVCLSSVVAISVSRGVSLQDAAKEYGNNLYKISKRTLQAIFQIVEASEQNGEQDGPRLYNRLLEHISTPGTISIFLDHVKSLYNDLVDDNNFWEWLELRYVSTVAASFKSAVEMMLPDVNTDDLLIDIENNLIWISEPESGGMGLINNIAASIRSRPGKFEEAFIYSSKFCQRHDLSEGLGAILSKVNTDELSHTFSNIRNALSLDEQREGLNQLQNVLYALGITPKRELIVALFHKFLNINSSRETDKLASILHQKWREEESRVECRIDPWVFIVAGIQLEDLREQIDDVLAGISPSAGGIDEKQRFTLADSLLWSKCINSCPDCLQIYSPFSEFASPSRALLGAFLEIGVQVIHYSDPQWKDRLYEVLKQGNRTRVVSGIETLYSCRQDVMQIIKQPVEIGYELLYPFICGIYNTGLNWSIDVGIREVLHE